MRVSSLIALAAVVLTTLYFIFLTPDWAKDMYLKATGYGPAETPTECVDRFLKAIKARDLNTASRYCTGDYAAQLKRGAAATKELGPLIDGVDSYMRDKGLATDKVVTMFHWLDPVPHNYKVRSAPKETGDAAVGFLDIDTSIWPNSGNVNTVTLGAELNQMDPRMFNKNLTARALYDPKGFSMVKENGSWKIKVPVPTEQVQAIDFFLNNYKAYATGLGVFRRDATNDRYASKRDFETEIVSVLQKAKG